MSSLPRHFDWQRFPHSWEKQVGSHSFGVAYTSGRDHLIRTEGHDYRNLDGRGPDKGGNFQLIRHEYSETSNYAVGSDPLNVSTYPLLRGDFGTWYRGPQLAYAFDVGVGSSVWPAVSSSSDISLSALGTTYISRVLPTNPVADLATFIGELREGLPKLAIQTFRQRSSRAKAAGGDYLNYQFGWKPLISDLQKFSKAVKNQEKILKQYERNSGKIVKRKRIFQDDVDVSVSTYSAKPSPDPYFWIHHYVIPGTMTATVTSKTKRWFSGAFTYYLEPTKVGDRNLWSQRANKLFGTRLTPEVVWNLAPWSWAADWVGNTGDVLHNVSAFANDGLVMPYAYVMEEKSVTHKYELKGVRFPRIENAPEVPYNFEQSFTTIVKKRLKATPYGFGLIPELDFSSRQWAIIAALGLSRSGKHK